MTHRDSFSGYHPLVNFLYFALVLVFAMFLLHPVSLALSLGSALLYAASLRGWRSLTRDLRFLLPVMLLAAIINPAFNHKGVTILTYLPTGNPLTLESMLYGMASAVMLASVILWFSCYSAVMTSDKFVYLFGRIIPAMSLILSMTLRFVPRFQQQLYKVSEAQLCLGRDISRGKPLERVKNAVAVLSILVTWSLENAIETADSMKSRGYGLPGRTAFSIYRLERRDELVLGWLLLCGGYLIYGWATGGFTWYYSPTLGGELSLSFQVAYLALCMTPIILNRKEDRQWRRMRSKI